MKTFEEILNDAPDITNAINNHSVYWAHIHEHKPPEELHEHISCVSNYAKSLVKIHGLEKVIDSLLINYTNGWESADFAAEQLKLLFVHTIVFHDFGKVNENFQVSRMKNTGNFSAKQNSPLNPPYGHSYLSTFLFLCYHIQGIFESKVSDNQKMRLICHCFFMAYPILQHHSPALIDVMEKEKYMSNFKNMLEPLKAYIALYGFNINESMLNGIFANIDDIWRAEAAKLSSFNSFPLFTLIKLNFSLLTAADYFSTHEYMNGSINGNEVETTDFGVFGSKNRVKEITEHLHSFKHNAQTFRNVDGYIFEYPFEKSNENLNKLRQEMAIELIQKLRGNLSAKLFYIEAPTGGGKTNLSIITVSELLISNPELNKVFYVFPFTTLITQTFGALKESLGLQDHEITELHSKSGLSRKQSTSDSEKENDGLYGKEKRDFIDNLFALYPATLLSHVKFFDILKTNKKENNYLLHRIANSIVVIDEIQSYNPILWDKMLYFISQYAYYFNIRFVVMSATLPKISNLNIGLTQKPEFVDLLPNARKYITNKNFSERVTFNFELYNGEIEMNELVEAVIEKSICYAKKTGSVRTIVEFIYKKSASEFQQLIAKKERFFDKVLILSGTVLESRRKEIINFIKRTTDDKINVLLITTQVVEAGVDIDMDLGFKNVSLIDSDEQLAGRVNRNALKENCEVYLFNLDDAKILYGDDYRFKETREHISLDQHREILQTKDFKKLYERVLNLIDKENSLQFKDNFKNYEADLQQLRFNAVDHNFKIIDQQNQTVFVPLQIPVYIDGTEAGKQEAIFSEYDLEFLHDFGIIPINNQIDGKEVWNIYESLIVRQVQKRKDKGGFDIKSKIDFKTLQSIMAKFSFSLLTYSKDYQSLLDGFGEEKYGYLCFYYWNDDRDNGKPYCYETGLNNKAFNDANFI